MTHDDIIRMAREAGDWNGQTAEFNDVGLERFAALIAAAERKRTLAFLQRLADFYEDNDRQGSAEDIHKIMARIEDDKA